MLFGADGVGPLRWTLAGQARVCGLPPAAAHDYVLAINEAVTNAVVHGGGAGQLLWWCQRTRLRCEIRDWGPGIPADRLTPGPAPTSASGGRGLWIAARLCRLELRNGQSGGAVADLAVPRPWRPDPAAADAHAGPLPLLCRACVDPDRAAATASAGRPDRLPAGRPYQVPAT